MTCNKNSCNCTTRDIIIQFSASWCNPCRILTNSIKNNEDFYDYMTNNTGGYFLVDIESQEPNHRDWTSLAKPTSVPTIVRFRKVNGVWKEIDRLNGIQSPQFIMQWVNTCK